MIKTITALLFTFSLLTAETTDIKSLTDLNTNKVMQIKDFYKKNLQKSCGLTAANFAQMHTQKEWIEMDQKKIFISEISTVCPKAQNKIISIIEMGGKKKFEDFYRFSVKYAKDTGVFPPC